MYGYRGNQIAEGKKTNFSALTGCCLHLCWLKAHCLSIQCPNHWITPPVKVFCQDPRLQCGLLKLSLTFDLPVKRENYKSVKHHIISWYYLEEFRALKHALNWISVLPNWSLHRQFHSSLFTNTHTHVCAHTRQKGVRRLSVCMLGDTRYLTFSDGRALKAIIGNVLRARREYL